MLIYHLVHRKFVYNFSLHQKFPNSNITAFFNQRIWINNATTFKIKNDIKSNIQMMIFKSILLYDIKELHNGKSQFQLTNPKVQNLIGEFYQPITQSQILDCIRQIEKEKVNFSAELEEQIGSYFSQLTAQQISIKQFLTILRSLQNIKDKTYFYQLIILKINDFLQSENNFQVPAYYIVHFFIFCRNLSILVAVDQINLQTFKNKIMSRNINSLSLNHFFTIICHDNFPKMNNLYGYKMYAHSLQILKKELNNYLKSKLLAKDLSQNDLKVLKSTDFYINLINYLKRNRINDLSLYELIENVFINNHFQTISVDKIQLVNVIFNVLGPTGAGEKLIKLQMDFNKGYPEEYKNFIENINFFVTIQSMNWTVAFDLCQAEKQLNQQKFLDQTDEYILTKNEFEWIKQKILYSQNNILIENYLSVDNIDHKFNFFLQAFQENPIYLQGTYYQLQTLVELYRGSQDHVKIFDKLLYFIKNISSESLVNIIVQSNEMNIEIEQQLIGMQISFEKEYAILPRRVDYYIKNLNLIIEADGEIHFNNEIKGTRKQQMRNLYYLLKGYRILIIPSVYWEFHRISGTTSNYLRNRIQYFKDNPDIVFIQ